MEHLPIRMRYGDLAIGSIEEGSGFGHPVIGRRGQGLMRFGSPAVGNREEGAGSGSRAIGNTDN